MKSVQINEYGQPVDAEKALKEHFQQIDTALENAKENSPAYDALRDQLAAAEICPKEAEFKRWIRYRCRRCYSMHSCKICGNDITLGELYRDGGYGRRAHEECVDRLVSDP